jgi:hypothetical protein
VATYSSDDPFLEEGDRFLFVLNEPYTSRRSRRGVSIGGDEQPGQPRLRILGGDAGAVRLDPSADLPDDALLNQFWEKVCRPTLQGGK